MYNTQARPSVQISPQITVKQQAPSLAALPNLSHSWVPNPEKRSAGKAMQPIAPYLVSHGSLHCLRHRCCLALPERYQDDLAGLQALASLWKSSRARQPQLHDRAHDRMGSITGVRHHAALSGQVQARFHARSLSWLAGHVKPAASIERTAMPKWRSAAHARCSGSTQAEGNQCVDALGARRHHACRMVATPMEMA